VMESLDWLAFGSIDHIAKFAKEYGWDALAEIGIGAIFVGVESKFAGDHGYDKRDEYDARDVFAKLHSMGIRTLGAWICGWDFHDHSNIYEDLNYFVACYPTFQQLTRLSPFPGTVLYDKLKEEGRVRNVPWEDVHFWSGAQVNVALESHETLNLTEYGYDLLYKTWGPSLLRGLDVLLNGYEYCINSSNPLMQNHKSVLFRNHASMLWCLLDTMDRFAPNGPVRRRTRKMDERYRQLIGEPTPLMKFLSVVADYMAKHFKKKTVLNPFNRYPKEEPFKRYTYTKNKSSTNGAVPYTTEWPTKRSFSRWASMTWENFKFGALAQAMKVVRIVKAGKGDPAIDEFLLKTIEQKNFIAF
jgi:hypothetical protein